MRLLNRASRSGRTRALERGGTALVTGASAGIGAGFAEALAARGLDLILVARRKDRLDVLAQSLVVRAGVRVDVVAADLATTGGLAEVVALARSRRVDVLINNAGFGTHGTFTSQDADRETQEIALNCGAVVALAHAVVPSMTEQRRGAIVNVASTAAFQGVPYMAVYGATKAFVLSFSSALHAELAPRGVGVLALCPGVTETEFFDVMRSSVRFGSSRSVEQVVATAIRGLERGRMVAIDGPLNVASAASSRLFPRPAVTAIAGILMRPRG